MPSRSLNGADAFLPRVWKVTKEEAEMLSEQLQDREGRRELRFSGALADEMTGTLPQEKTWV